MPSLSILDIGGFSEFNEQYTSYAMLETIFCRQWLKCCPDDIIIAKLKYRAINLLHHLDY